MPRNATRTLALTAAVTLVSAAAAQGQQVVARAVSAAGDVNLTSYTNAFDPAGGGTAFSSPADGFGIFSLVAGSDEGQSVPFALVDDSADDFMTDTLGIVVDGPNADTAPFFGITDSRNADSNEGPVTATFTFDVSGAQSATGTLSIDLAAIGDFEGPGNSSGDPATADDFTFTFGGQSFDLLVDEDAAKTYTLASGTTVSYDDPLELNGTELSNAFQTFTFENVDLSGGTLTFGITADADGGGEAVAFRNLVVTTGVIPEPASLGLAGVAALGLLARRRRA